MLRLLRSLVFTIGGVSRATDRLWTDPRDGTSWTVWLETTGAKPVLAFGSEGEVHKVVVDFDDGLEHLSNEDLQRFLDEARGATKLAGELEG